MIKRASTILLTLFLLLTSAQVWGAIVCSQTVGGSNFQIKSGTSGNSLENIQTFGNDAFSANASDYTLTPGKLTLKGNLNKDVLTHTISGLPTSGNTEYTITFNYKSNGNTEFRFKWKEGTSDKYGNTINAQNGPCSFTAKSTNGSITYTLEEYGNQKANIEISSITITGCIEQQIVSSNGNVLCKGEENTFTAIGLSGAITWSMNGTTLGTGTSYTGIFSDDGTIKATSGSTTLTYNFKTVLCCSASADRTIVALETFKTPNTGQYFEVDDLNRSVYTNYTPAKSNKPQEDQYAIVKTTDGTFENWYRDNGARPVLGHTRNNTDITADLLNKYNQANGKDSNYDGYILANCNEHKYPATNSIIFEYDIQGICANTFHDFSAFISNVDAKAGEAAVNLLFEVVELNGTTEGNKLLSKESRDIPCGDQSWKEYGGSFKVGTITDVRLKLYNNNQTATVATGGKIAGNDVAVDDITFSRCVPRINVHFDENLTSFSKSDICNDTDQTISLYVGHHDYIIAKDLLPGGHFIVEQRINNGAWTLVMPAPLPLSNNAFEKVDVTVNANQEPTEYRAIVAPTATDVLKIVADNNATLTGCGVYNITKPDTYAKLSYTCSGPKSEKPTLGTYSECPNPSKPTLDLKTLVTSIKLVDGTTHNITDPLQIANYGTITFYDENGTALNSSTIDISSTLDKKFYATFTQNPSNTDYRESDKTEFKVIIRTEVPIILEIDGVEYGPQNPYTICNGKQVILHALHTLVSGESAKWVATDEDGTTTLPDVTTSITVTPTKDTEYKVEIINNTCRIPGYATIKVITSVKPVISADKYTICKGTAINITDSNTETATSYKWYFKPMGGSWQELNGFSDKNITNYTPEKTGDYKVTTGIGECTDESNVITIVVGDQIEFKVSATPDKICEGGSSFIKMSGHPATATIQWYEGNNTDPSTGIKKGNNEAEVSVSPTISTLYTASVKDICEATKEVYITVDGKITKDIIENQDICLEKSTTIWASGGDIKWYVDNQQVGEGTNITVSPIDTTKYTAQITNGVCKTDTFMYVNVHELPVIESIIVTENDQHEREIEITTDKGTEPYIYSLDGEIYDVPSEILKNVPIGWNLLYVKDKFECKSTKEFYVEPIPIIPAKFFTPNGDGKNEKWTVKNLETYDSYIVEIFDRYGKRLFVQRVGSFSSTGKSDVTGDEFEGWEGDYNGHPMPSDDYWYLITVEEIRKQYTGHFTLKR